MGASILVVRLAVLWEDGASQITDGVLEKAAKEPLTNMSITEIFIA